MKKKRIGSTILAVAMASLISLSNFTFFNAPQAHAAEQGITKTATLNNAKVSFNGAEPIEVQAYNIDGYNYFRARDITNGLNMHVEPIGEVLGETIVGIRIFPDKPSTSSEPLEKLTDNTIQANLVKGSILFTTSALDVQCFNYNGRYYFKVADIAEVTQKGKDSMVDLTRMYAEGRLRDKPSQDSYTSINSVWNSTSSTINLTCEETDLWAVFSGSYVEPEPIKIDPQSSSLHPQTLKYYEEMVNGTYKPIEPDFKKQPPLAAPPKEGTRLANILVDESIGAYFEDGVANHENIQPFYKYNNLTAIVGECTWYAEGRFSEVTGVDSRKNKYWSGFNGSVTYWLDNITDNNCPDVVAIHDKNDVQAQAIVIYKGHAAFIEYVERDANGNPITVYITEANYGHRANGLEVGKYYPDYDCLVRAMEWKEFVGDSTLIGYIVAK